MNLDLILGLLATGVPLLGLGYLMLAKQHGIYRMFVAMVLIGLGYLTMTGAINDIGAKITGSKSAIPMEAEAPAPAPAPTPAAPAPGAPAPAM